MINAAAPLTAAGATEPGRERGKSGSAWRLWRPAVRKSVKKKPPFRVALFSFSPPYRSPIERFRGGVGLRGVDWSSVVCISHYILDNLICQVVKSQKEGSEFRSLRTPDVRGRGGLVPPGWMVDVYIYLIKATLFRQKSETRQ